MPCGKARVTVCCSGGQQGPLLDQDLSGLVDSSFSLHRPLGAQSWREHVLQRTGVFTVGHSLSFLHQRYLRLLATDCTGTYIA